MGTWGAGITEDDLALDVIGDYKIICASNNSKKAIKKIMEQYSSVIGDDDDEPIFWFALANYQLVNNSLRKIVKKNALKHLLSGENLKKWKVEADETNYEKRKAVLEELKLSLENYSMK